MTKPSMKKILKTFLAASLLACWVAQAWAQDPMAQAKAFFIQQHYWQAIQECGEVIKKNPGNPDILSEANYFSGASYANLFDFLTAKKNFSIIVEKYKGSKYYEDAYLGLGDVEFFGENLYEALKVYTGFYITNPSRKRLATLYFRLSEVNLKLGNKEEYKKSKVEFINKYIMNKK